MSGVDAYVNGVKIDAQIIEEPEVDNSSVDAPNNNSGACVMRGGNIYCNDKNIYLLIPENNQDKNKSKVITRSPLLKFAMGLGLGAGVVYMFSKK